MRGAKHKILVVTAPVILACVVFAPRLVTRSHFAARPQKAPLADVRHTSLVSDSADDEVAGDDMPENLDLYGNEVTDAVAKYRFDASGSLYELHSPQTEVPRLAPPKT